MALAPASVFRQRISDRSDPVVCPGVTDGLVARIAAAEGFESVYVSGFGSAAARGLPDMGVMSLTELVDAVDVIVEASGLWVVVDADTGFGGSVGIRRAMIELASAGAAAVQIEDQALPRRCGYLTQAAPAPVHEMLERLEAVRAANTGLVVIARTDALLTEGMDLALERARAYCRAGVDLLMVNGISRIHELERFHDELGFPMLHNVSGSDRTPALTPDQAEHLNVRVVIYPVQAARAGALAARHYLSSLKGEMEPPDLLPFSEYMDYAGWSEAQAFEEQVIADAARGEGK